MDNSTQKDDAGVSVNRKIANDIVESSLILKILRACFVREGRFVRSGWLAVLVTLIFGVICGHWYGARGTESLKGQLRAVQRERDKYQLMLAPFEAAALARYTNEPVNKRIDLLAKEIEAERPTFRLFINNMLVTNGMTVSLRESRSLLLRVLNLSQYPADDLTVAFTAPSALSESNVMGEFWTYDGGGVAVSGNRTADVPFVGYWRWQANGLIAGGGYYSLNPLRISTNVVGYPVIGVEFSVYSKGSAMRRWRVGLRF